MPLDAGPIRLVIVCEGIADRTVACGLLDRLIVSSIDWIEGDYIDHYRTYCGMTVHAPCLLWKNVKAEAERRGVRLPRGHFSGDPAELDARAARRALRLLMHADIDADVVALVRDTDDQPSRVQGLEQARNWSSWPFAVLIGTAVTKRECWVLAGFIPRDQEEQKLVAAARQELGFDPSSQSHELTAKQDNARRSAKRVLRQLTQDDPAREEVCWRETPLDQLRKNDNGNRLSLYLDELSEHVIPLLSK